MSDCRWCNEDLTGKQVYCSDRCRMAWNREQEATRTEPEPQSEQIAKPNTVESEQNQPEQPKRTASYQDYIDNRQDYAGRAKPDKLNWGPYLPAEDLDQLGVIANRVPIPGDWDYVGVAV